MSVSPPREKLIQFDEENLHTLKGIINGKTCYRVFKNGLLQQ
jgi:hypothetical protein